MTDNTAGSCEIGFLLHDGDGRCASAHGLMVYGSKIGVLGNPSKARNLFYKDLVVIDCEVGVALKMIFKGR